MKLLDAGEVLPSAMILDLVSAKLANRECQKRGWILEGIATAGTVDELEEAIVMATEVRSRYVWHELSRRITGRTSALEGLGRRYASGRRLRLFTVRGFEPPARYLL